jgi:eukaryotic-like serine/threonine-protein kinase
MDGHGCNAATGDHDVTAGGRDFEHDPDVAATVTGMMSQRELVAGEVVAGRFRILRILGMGGMGLVYQAHDIELDIDVALKLLRPELASRPDAFERFRKELLLARQVSSPHVVRIHDLVRHDQAWLISMDYVAGQSLERLLSEQRTLSPERALDITRQLALGLAAAHQRQVIHRDLKPANVMVGEDGEVRITDFGVARTAGETGITGSGVVIGTPEYLSPEQARAEPLDARSDLYALGLILYEMLTGTLPFRGGTPAEMLVQRIVRDPPPADTVDPALPPFAVKLCAWLLELRVARRIASAEAVVQAIDSGKLTGRPRARWHSAQWLTLAAMLCLTAAAGWYWQQQFRPSVQGTMQTTVAAPLDLLPLPWASSDDPGDIALAAGIRQLLGVRFSDDSALQSADPLRVDRALTELGYDASAADRQHQRVLDTMHARHALEGELQRESNGWLLKLRLVNPDSPTPQWSAQQRATDESGLPAALGILIKGLNTQLTRLPAAIDWPSAAELRALGTASIGAVAIDDVEAARAQALQFHSPELWWQLLRRLDRSGRSAEAADLAASASDDLKQTDTPAARRALAYAELLLGDAQTALATIAAVTSKASSDHPARLLQARCEAELGNYDVAIRQLRDLVAEDPRNIDAWYALGKYSIQAGDAKPAVDEYLVRAEVLANRLKDKSMRADISHAYGIGYRRLGQMEAAAEQLRRAVTLREALGDRRGQAASLRNLSTVLSMQGMFDPAEKALDEARTITEALGDSRALADLANARGALDEERGNYRGALDAYRDSLRLRQSLGDDRSIGESLNNVGYAYYQLGEFDNAQTYWQQSAATYEKIDDRYGLVHAHQSQALAEIARGDWVSARSLLDETLRTAETLQMAEERTVSLATLAELDRLEGRITAALQESETALTEFEQRKDQRGVVEMKLLRGAIATDLGDFRDAQQAIGDLAPDNVAEQASTLRWRQAEVDFGLGHAEQALKAVDEAIAQAVSAHSYAAELQARLLKVRILGELAQPVAAAKELHTVKDGLVRYASIPMRLELAETALRLGGTNAAADYQQARNLLARLPSYVNAFAIHQYGSRGAPAGSAARAQASQLAHKALDAVLANTPLPRQKILREHARSIGMLVDPAP